MIEWEKGHPVTTMLCGLVIYMEDYEFARWMNGKWTLLFNDGMEIIEKDPQHPIEYYCRLNYPDKDGS